MKGLAWRERDHRITASREVLTRWAGGESLWTWLMAGQTLDAEIADLELGWQAALWWVASPYDTPQLGDGLMYWENAEAPCPFCRGTGDCIECDPETQRK